MSGHIDHIFYINLDKREDRKELMNCELEKYKLNAERFPAVFNPNNGLVGCGYSHLRVLELAKERNYKNVLILEDDFYFIESKDVVETELEKLFYHKPDFDVCFLSYNLHDGFVCETTPFLMRTLYSATASGYIVNHHYYDKLIELYRINIPLLETTGQDWIYANDQIWKNLQATDNWFCFTKRLGKQRAGFSDNGNSYVDYNC
jgi:GR25 family glycosyltransferase involved in LPS biosynthesis